VIEGGLTAAGRGLALAGLAPAGLGLLLALAAPLILAGLAIGVLLNGPDWRGNPVENGGVRVLPFAGLAVIVLLVPAALRAVRRLANLTRRLCGQWCGVPIAAPYLPPPCPAGSAGEISFRRRLGWMLADRATWRDVLWLAVNTGGWVLAAAPAVLLAGVVVYLLHPANNHEPAAILFCIAFAGFGLWAAPRLLQAYGGLAHTMLAPTARAELALRVRHLAETRSETIDSGAAEMRRIERDLHDGAQARLVAMGMTLEAAGQLLDSDPAAARALLIEARDASARALAELRDLVRGIHPPVLADRGLADAIRALTLDSPLRAELAGAVAGRLPAPVESAAYFAVSELLANVSKHAAATRTWIDIRHSGGMLRIGVTDDGYGGADPARGTGLRGIERRLAAFDGVLAVSSPPGGPTAVTMEIPCALSSPKTSSY
jgi:signal transduction histidine kinase